MDVHHEVDGEMTLARLEYVLRDAIRSQTPPVQIWPRGPRVLLETERRGIGFFFATWSGHCVARWTLLYKTLGGMSHPPTVYAMDADELAQNREWGLAASQLLGSEFPGVHGWGEMFWFRDAHVLSSLRRPEPDEVHLMDQYTEDWARGP